MPDTTLSVKDAAAATKSVLVQDNTTSITPYHKEDTAQRAALVAILEDVALDATVSTGNATLASILAKIIAAPATEAKQDTSNTALGAIQTAIQVMDDWDESNRCAVNVITGQSGITGGAGAVSSATPRITHASDDPLVTAVGAVTASPTTNTVLDRLKYVGTRAYATSLTRVTVAASSAQSAAITATEVLLHASTRCFVAIGASPTATNNDIPLEAGEKFHARITSGDKVAVIQDTAGGFLNVIPVA